MNILHIAIFSSIICASTSCTPFFGLFGSNAKKTNDPLVEEMEKAARSRGLECWINKGVPCPSQRACQAVGARTVLQFAEHLEKNGTNHDVALFSAAAATNLTGNDLFVTPEEAPYAYALAREVSHQLHQKTPPLFFRYHQTTSSTAYHTHIAINYHDIKELSRDEQKALLAHEESHRFYTHEELRTLQQAAKEPVSLEQQRATELQADQMAAFIAGTPATISMLTKICAPCAPQGANPSDDWLDGAAHDKTHPCLETRIKKLQEWQRAQDQQESLKK